MTPGTPSAMPTSIAPTATGRKILVVEDDVSLSKLLVSILGKLGHDARAALSGTEARRLEAEWDPDLILLDVRLPDCSGFDLLVDFVPQRFVVMMTAYGSVDQAVRAVRTGASEYLVKPIGSEALELALERVFATAELHRDVRYWQSQAKRGTASAIIGDSAKLTEMRRQAELYAAAGSTVLIEGESGTGKELVARAIHQASSRAAQRFIPIDCDPSQETTTAAELFGTGTGREGMLDFADGGTLYLSDIAEISPAMQSRVLRVLETGTFRRMGGSEDVATNARIIVATSHDLRQLVERKEFRSELYFRLSAFRIHVPSLRERIPDVPLLAQYFVESRQFQKGVSKQLARETLAALTSYDWPGNVRELRNAIERGIIMSGTSPNILPGHVSFGEGRPAPKPEADDDSPDSGVMLRFADEPCLEDLRAAYLRLLLDRYDGNRRKVAKILGISERNAYRLIGRLDDDAQVSG